MVHRQRINHQGSVERRGGFREQVRATGSVDDRIGLLGKGSRQELRERNGQGFGELLDVQEGDVPLAPLHAADTVEFFNAGIVQLLQLFFDFSNMGLCRLLVFDVEDTHHKNCRKKPMVNPGFANCEKPLGCYPQQETSKAGFHRKELPNPIEDDDDKGIEREKQVGPLVQTFIANTSSKNAGKSRQNCGYRSIRCEPGGTLKQVRPKKYDPGNHDGERGQGEIQERSTAEAGKETQDRDTETYFPITRSEYSARELYHQCGQEKAR